MAVVTDRIMHVVFFHHVMVQLEEKGSLVRSCQPNNNNRIWLKWPSRPNSRSSRHHRKHQLKYFSLIYCEMRVIKPADLNLRTKKQQPSDRKRKEVQAEHFRK